MRNLSVRQKKALKSLYEEYGLLNIDSVRDLTLEQSRAVSNIYDTNPHETFYHNADRYLWDLHWEQT